jgi:hypothetical protein
MKLAKAKFGGSIVGCHLAEVDLDTPQERL